MLTFEPIKPFSPVIQLTVNFPEPIEHCQSLIILDNSLFFLYVTIFIIQTRHYSFILVADAGAFTIFRNYVHRTNFCLKYNIDIDVHNA